jgi:hypothetical protein
MFSEILKLLKQQAVGWTTWIRFLARTGFSKEALGVNTVRYGDTVEEASF